MAKTWYGHYIFADLIKGEKFVKFSDYLELDKKLMKTQEFIKYLKDKINDIDAEIEAIENFNGNEEDKYYLLVRRTAFKEMLDKVGEV